VLCRNVDVTKKKSAKRIAKRKRHQDGNDDLNKLSDSEAQSKTELQQQFSNKKKRKK